MSAQQQQNTSFFIVVIEVNWNAQNRYAIRLKYIVIRIGNVEIFIVLGNNVLIRNL